MKNPFSLVVSFFSWILDRTLLIFELSVDFTLGTLDIFLSIFRTFYIILKYMIEYRTLQAPRDVWEYSGFIYIANTLILGYIGLVVLLNFFAYFPIFPETINKIANFFAVHQRQYVSSQSVVLQILGQCPETCARRLMNTHLRYFPAQSSYQHRPDHD